MGSATPGQEVLGCTRKFAEHEHEEEASKKCSFVSVGFQLRPQVLAVAFPNDGL